jgi:signal transduction histidine kinase
MQIWSIALLAIIIFQFFSYKKDYSNIKNKLRQKQASLDEVNIRLREVDMLKSEIVSLAAHQIRSPLVAIEGYVSMMEEGDFGDINDNMKDAVTSISTSADYLMTLVNEFLDISRLEHSQMKFDMTDIDLSDLVEDVTHDYYKAAREKGIEFEFIRDESKRYMIHADELKTGKIIGSIIDNAIKYTVKGWVKLELEKLDGKIRLSIKDTGIGIDKKDQKKLFDKFFRTSMANDVFVRGTGLGLYIAKHMLNAQGANIWLSSEGVGSGSVFVIEFESKN